MKTIQIEGQRKGLLEIERVLIRVDGTVLIQNSQGRLQLPSPDELSAIQKAIPSLKDVAALLRTKKTKK